MQHTPHWQRMAATLSAVLAVLCTFPVLAEVPDRLWTEKSFATPLDPDAPISMRAFARLAKDLSPAVVNIGVTKKGRFSGHAPTAGNSLGTGFIIHADGYLLTNNHVIDGAATITVTLDNEHEYAARVVGTYLPLDVALLKIESKEGLTVAPLGSSDALEIGEWVVAIGNPFGLSHTVTAGIVSAKGRHDVVRGPEQAKFIQTDASINPGNSGGPLINIRGEVIGINTAINAAGQGIGFAVPVDRVKTILAQLAEGKVDRSYLGVKVGPVNKAVARNLGLRRARGALIIEVVEGTPADEAGIKAGDVVVQWNDKPVKDPQDLVWFASTQSRDDVARLMVNRRAKEVALEVRLTGWTDRSGPVSSSTSSDQADIAALGMIVAPPSVEARVGRPSREPAGLEVTKVARDGLAARLGIKPGDIITQVNYDAVTSTAMLSKAVDDVPSGEMLSFTLRRGNSVLFKAITK
ncbi:MAG: serine protease Do [Myxococcota bacterium]|jgi:serine protease Do